MLVLNDDRSRTHAVEEANAVGQIEDRLADEADEGNCADLVKERVDVAIKEEL